MISIFSGNLVSLWLGDQNPIILVASEPNQIVVINSYMLSRLLMFNFLFIFFW